MGKIIASSIAILSLIILMWAFIADVVYDTNPRAQVRRWTSRYSDAYREGYPCITFEFFISLYAVNPKKWVLKDPIYGCIYYYKNECHYYGFDCDKLYWKTSKDIKQYRKWYREELKRQSEEKSAQKIKEISELGLKDIEALKNKINQNAQSEFERIDREREKNSQFYFDLINSTSLTSAQAKYLIDKYLKKEEQE